MVTSNVNFALMMGDDFRWEKVINKAMKIIAYMHRTRWLREDK